MRSSSFFLATALATASLCPAQTAPSTHTPVKSVTPTPTKLDTVPEIIFFNGVIYSGNGLANDKPEIVQAMAIGGGKVLAVGTTEAITRLAGPSTRLRDLNTASTSTYIFPGINDAHVHLGSAGRTKLNVDLTGVKSLAEMLAKIQSFANAAPSGHWLTGGNWDHTLWEQKVLPTRQDLDRVTAGHPTFLGRIDGHIAIANSAALTAAGITGKTVPPQGGAIDLDTSGNPTGILRESAQSLIEKVIPPPSHEDRRRGDELAIADALAHGVTSVQDFSDWEDFLVYEELEKEGKLNLRITEWLPFNAPLPDLIRMRNHHDMSDPMLRTGFLKGFMDGSLGSRTAAMKSPYADDPGNTGLPQYTQDQLNKMAVERARFGFQLGFHAIGDKATSMALDAFTLAEKPQTLPVYQPGPCRPAGQPYEIWDEKLPCSNNTTPTKPASPALCKLKDGSPCYPILAGLPPRNRIEHAQVVDPADIPRFKSLGVIASMQPSHLLTDMNWAESRLGPQRAAYSYAWKAFLDAGVPLAFGTDYPVEPITPFRGLYAAVTRKNEAGTKTYFPENKLTRGQALYAYTQGSAYAEFAEKHKGKLAPGYDADFILVDRDLYKIVPPAILHTVVEETYVSGKQAYAGNIETQ
ncbi:MAG: amidohydrolase [Terracidiphilus sp.]|jgi:predicted amidohydrolase YtcJ